MLRFAALATILLTLAGSVTAAEEKKYDPNKTYLVIHSDDAAMCHSVNVAMMQSFEAGTITSASCMVPCPWFPEWAAWAKEHPEYDFGIHLTLNCEWGEYKWGPVAGRENVPSLCDEKGYLLRSDKDTIARAVLSEVETELRAQIERAKAFGMEVTHLDPHVGTLLERPDMTEIYVNLGIEYGIPVLFSSNLLGKKEVPEEFVGLTEGRNEQLLAALNRNNLPAFDAIMMMYEDFTLQERIAKYADYVRSLKPGFHELIVHCGIGNEELKAVTGNWEVRDTDFHALQDPGFRDEIKKLGIELISFEDFHKLGVQRLEIEKKNAGRN